MSETSAPPAPPLAVPAESGPDDASRKPTLRDFDETQTLTRFQVEDIYRVKDQNGHLGVFCCTNWRISLEGFMVIPCSPATTAIDFIHPADICDFAFWLVEEGESAIKLLRSERASFAHELMRIDMSTGWRLERVLSHDLVLLSKQPQRTDEYVQYAIQHAKNGVMPIEGIPKKSILNQVYAHTDIFANPEYGGFVLLFSETIGNSICKDLAHLVTAGFKIHRDGRQERIL